MSVQFLDRFAENAQKMADKVVLVDDQHSKGVTYRQLDILSGRIYAYLKQKGIGKEDFVLICLPRGIQPIMAMWGVWKSGAAFVIVEDNYAPERINFIREDCGCKVVIDADVWQEIQHCEPITGHEDPDGHDAAFAVYTSGTTGNPKGVLHEYGNIDRMIDSVTMRSCGPLAGEDDRFALVAPLNFVASQLIILYGLNFGILNYVVPYATVKNPLAIGLFIIRNKITGTFLTPSYIRSMKTKPDCLKFCIIGSEPANEVYMDGMTIHNFYLMSESGFAVSHFLIDHKYEYTPVGKSEAGFDIQLLDEAGNPVADGEEGEVCFENPYVRGYMNLPEETEKAFKDGFYHTGDLARMDETGNMIICGRMNDMVKINGNRVEPAEIENIAKKVLGVDWTAARIFDDGHRVNICVYYTDKKVKVDFEKTRHEMERYLPYYMLPSYFMHIDSVPLRPNGKMDRKALPAPEIDNYRAAYAAPENDTEKALCKAFETVLKVNGVGIDDDFYQLGGDSMSSMEVLTVSELPGLQSSEIFRGHTPRKIAKLYLENHVADDGIPVEEKNAELMKTAHPLTTEQTYMVDYQLYTPASTMYNLYYMLKLDKDVINMEEMGEAVYKAALAHPALLTTFAFNEDGEIYQSYKPELFEEVKVEKVDELDIKFLKDTLVRPFKIFGGPLIHCRLFETRDAGYLFMEVHHSVFDGTSSKVFFADILRAYAGDELQTDLYYYVLDKREKQKQSNFYAESREYFEKRYGGVNWSKRPKTDHQSRSNEAGEIYVPIPTTAEMLEEVEAGHGITHNMFFISAAMLATAYYNEEKDIMLSWIYNGRDDMSEMQSVGLLFRNLPVAIRLHGDMKIKDIYADILEQVNKGIEHSCYPYVELTSGVVDDDLECVLYQDNLREMDDIPGVLDNIDINQNLAASQNILDLEILNSPDGMVLMMDYAASLYEESSIRRFGDVFGTMISILCQNKDNDDMTVKDLVKKANKLLGKAKLFLNPTKWLD